MTDLFKADATVQAPQGDDTSQGDTNYLDRLVGPGKKFATVEDLAKGKWESDETFIPQITKENKELRDTVSQQTTLQEILDKLDERARTSSQEPTGDDDSTRGAAKAAMSKEDIAALVKQIANEERTQASQEQNLMATVQELKRAWGDNWQRTLVSKREELGLTEEFMNSIAYKSPKALLNLVGASTQTRQVNPNAHLAPKNQMATNASGDQMGTVKNEAYWEKMFQKDPDLYKSPAMVVERHKAAIKLGRSYFE